MVPVTVLIRNPGVAQITLNQVQLYFSMFNITQRVNVTKDYRGVLLPGGGILAAYANRSFIFSVNATATANLGEINIDAHALYNSTILTIGAIYPGSWTIIPIADLNILTITSSVSVVHPGQAKIPVTVRVENPGTINVTVVTVKLTFKQGSLDVSNDYLTTCLTTFPVYGLNRGAKSIFFNVTVGISATAGGVTVDAIVTGSASVVPLSDSGAVTPLTWAVQTSASPVIASIIADKPVYWTGQVVTLSVTCDKAGHIVKADFTALDSSSNTTAKSGNPYTVTHTLGIVTAGTKLVTVYASNATGALNQTIAIRLGQAPTFSGLVQTPYSSPIRWDVVVNVTIQISSVISNATVVASFKYNVNGAGWNLRAISHTGGVTRWTVLIPNQPSGGVLTYVINASDSQGNWNTFTNSYTVSSAPVTPVFSAESTHAPNNASKIYTTVPGNGAPLGSPVAYTASIDTTYMQISPGYYYVIVSAFAPNRMDWVSINTSVYLTKPSITQVTLQLTFLSSQVPSGTIITGKMYITTGLPSTGGKTLAWISFSHLVQ
jgi:hypothetical protein